MNKILYPFIGLAAAALMSSCLSTDHTAAEMPYSPRAIKALPDPTLVEALLPANTAPIPSPYDVNPRAAASSLNPARTQPVLRTGPSKVATPHIITPARPSISLPPPAPSTAVTGIPTAKAVPGDPHRVYNPWNPSLRIRITDSKTGQPFVSGKVLKVPGTSNFFRVP